MKILCVCPDNVIRSPMMVGLLRQKLSHDDTIESAGTKVRGGQPANEHAIFCMKQRGIDISDHRSRSIAYFTQTDFRECDLILCATAADKRYVEGMLSNMPGVSVPAKTLNIPDPHGGGRQAYHRCADETDDALDIAVIPTLKSVG